jgi:hypothetical protein
MNLNTMLQQTNAVEAISRELGVDHETARKGAEALLPSLLGGFRAPAAPPSGAQGLGGGALGGLGGLIGAIGGLGGGGLLDNVLSPQPTEVGKGNDILGQVFGSKDRSRDVATQASARSGVPPTLLKKMLPILAMIVAGYVMKQAGHGGGQTGGGGLGGVLGGGLGGGLGNVLGGVLGGGGQHPASAGGHGGDILGDLIGAAGRYLGR